MAGMLLALLAIVAVGDDRADAHLTVHPQKKLFSGRWYKPSVDLTASPPWFGVPEFPNAQCDGGYDTASCLSKWHGPAYASYADWNSQPSTARFNVQGSRNHLHDNNIYIVDNVQGAPPGLLGYATYHDQNGQQCLPEVYPGVPYCPIYRYSDAVIIDNNHTGVFGNAQRRQATITHELGHVLTLRHESVNADESQLYNCGQDNTGPIPPSVMSYHCVWPAGPPYYGAGIYTVQDWDTCGVNHAYPGPAFEWESCVCYPPAPGGAASAGPPAYYHALTPARILDTRSGPGPTGRLGFGCHIDVQVAGVGGVPASGVTAVVLNVTVTNPSRGSFLTVYPSDASLPVASNLNFGAGQTVPNLVTVKVGADGRVRLYNAAGQTHVIFDVVGWYGGTTGDLPSPTPTATATPASLGPPAAPPGSVTTYQLNALHDGHGTGWLTTPLSDAWSVNLGGTLGYPLVVNGRVFVATAPGGAYGAQLYAIDEQTGSILWGPVDLPGTYYINGIAADGANVYSVNFDGLLRAFNQATGEEVWQRQLTQSSFTSPPTVSGGIIYVGGAGGGGTVYAVNASTGSILWTAGVANGDHSSPAVTNDGVYVSYACPNVYRLHPVTGQMIWRYPDPPGCSGGGGHTPVVHGDRVYVRDGPTPLVLATANGSQMGAFSSVYAPAFDGNLAFYTPWSGSTISLAAIDLTTGATLWTQAGNVTTAPIVVDGKVIIGFSGSVEVYDEYTGAPLWSGNTTAAIGATDEHNAWMLTGLAAADGMLFVPATSTLVAYKSASTPTPTATTNVTPTPTATATATPTPTPTAPPTPTATPAPAGYYHPLPPTRIVDTRAGRGWPAKLGHNGTATVDVTDTFSSGVPASGATAVVLNVTVTDATGGSYLTVYPAGVAPPVASNLNFGPGQTVANLVIVKVGAGGAADGKVNVFNAVGQVHVIFDVVGWYGQLGTDGRLFRSLAPARILDTRSNLGWAGALGHNGIAQIDVTGVGGVPATAKAVIVNATVTGGNANSYLTVWPSDASQPVASNLNFLAGQTVPNLVMVKVATSGPYAGFVNVYNCCGQVHAIFDVVGYFE